MTDYRNKRYVNGAVWNVMTANRFWKIKVCFNMDNNDDYVSDNPDRLFKLRPMLNCLKDRVQSIPYLLSIYVQICASQVGYFHEAISAKQT